MNDHHGCADEADRGRCQRPDHLLAHLTAVQLGFALLVSHSAKASDESIDQFTKGVKALLLDPASALKGKVPALWPLSVEEAGRLLSRR